MKIIQTRSICSSQNIIKSPAVVMPFVSYRIFGWKPVEISAEHNLRTLTHGTSYQICCSCFCHACDFVFTDLRFDEEELTRLYKDYRGAEYVTQKQMFEPDYISIDNYLKKQVKQLKEIKNLLIQLQ